DDTEPAMWLSLPPDLGRDTGHQPAAGHSPRAPRRRAPVCGAGERGAIGREHLCAIAARSPAVRHPAVLHDRAAGPGGAVHQRTRGQDVGVSRAGAEHLLRLSRTAAGDRQLGAPPADLRVLRPVRRGGPQNRHRPLQPGGRDLQNLTASAVVGPPGGLRPRAYDPLRSIESAVDVTIPSNMAPERSIRQRRVLSPLEPLTLVCYDTNPPRCGRRGEHSCGVSTASTRTAKPWTLERSRTGMVSGGAGSVPDAGGALRPLSARNGPPSW